MKLKITKSDLYKCLQKVSGVVPVKTALPILNNLMLSAEGNLLKILATDLEVSIETNTPATIEEEGAITIPSKMLNEIIRELPDIPLSLQTDDETKSVKITTDIGTYKINGESEEEFPNLPIMEKVEEVVFKAELLDRLISKTIFAASQDELRPALVGILLEIFHDEIRAVSTDGHRLAKIINKEFKSKFEGKVIIPKKALALVQRFLGDIEEVSVRIGENHVSFSFENTTVYSRLINDRYPDYERVIPQNNDKILQVNHAFFNASIKRIAIFANPVTHQIKISLYKNKVEISTKDVDFGGEAREVIEADYSGEEMEIGYNANYMIDILKHIDSEEIVLKLNSSTSAGIPYPSVQHENEELMMLAMPVRLNER